MISLQCLRLLQGGQSLSRADMARALAEIFRAAYTQLGAQGKK